MLFKGQVMTNFEGLKKPFNVLKFKHILEKN
jgi:hypothetical protein